jgi:hypothetical protein
MTGTKKIIHFLSASDRINYGDLLFPIILKKILLKNNIKFVFKNYGLINSNLTYFGALKTGSYLKLLKNIKSEGGNLIIGGGEVFFAKWTILYGFINPLYVKFKKNIYISKIENKFKIAKYLLCKGKVLIPFAPSKKELRNPKVEIFYNAVGGNFSGNHKNRRNKVIVNNLFDAKYISVRDKRTQNSLSDYGVQSNLVPDSALIMSDLFPIEELEKLQSFSNEDMPKKYIFLQLGIHKSPKEMNNFLKKTEDQAIALNLEVVLCPIGMAVNHEDHIVLEKIAKYSPKFHFFMPKNIYEIMYLIAKSEVFLGTSLHGVITAQSFNIPFVPLNLKINKLDAYCKSWTNSVCNGCISFSDIGKLSAILNKWDYNIIKEETKRQKEKVYENFEMIFKKLI